MKFLNIIHDTIMGQAKNRGTAAQRAAEAMIRDRREMAKSVGLLDEDSLSQKQVQAGIAPFFAKMSPEEWQRRRTAILNYLDPLLFSGTKLAQAKPIRFRDDEIGWYLFLCDQHVNDPLFNDVAQAQRILPFFAGIGARWQFSHMVQGLDKKIDELLTRYRKDPDGVLFEVSAALGYAEAGWQVEFLDEMPGEAKTPDMRVTREGVSLYVECKRMQRRTEFAETERNAFLRLWDKGTDRLYDNGQWIWFKGTFHTNVSQLPENFFADLWDTALPISAGEQVLMDTEHAIIHARLIDQSAVRQGVRDNFIKVFSGAFTNLVGGDWAAENSDVSMIQICKPLFLKGCPEALGAFTDDVSFACGFTRSFDSPEGIDKKAKNVLNHFKEAMEQVPEDFPSIIHIASETMEGAEVERLRSRKVKDSLAALAPKENGIGKPVAMLRYHRVQAHQRINMAFEFDETVDWYFFEDSGIDPAVLAHLPMQVIAPPGNNVAGITHWDLYS